MNTSSHKHPAIILAGGQSLRMGGRDKGLIDLGGERMVDRVAARLSVQCQSVLISGPHDYGLGFKCIPDLPDAPAGPAAGLYSILLYFLTQPSAPAGFFTVPVDSPDLPPDLCDRLYAGGQSAIAADKAGLHPVFGWWRLADLQCGFLNMAASERRSLTALAVLCDCRHVMWPGTEHFINLNAPDDLAQYKARDRA